ncbi:MAG: hypothetical protein R3F65_33585 [bacterium]
MSFTTIINGEGDAMRHLEKKDASKPAPKTPTKRSSKKADEALLVLANGDMGEAARLGMSLVGSGVTAFTFGMLEGLARKGKVEWWGKLAPHKRGLILMAFVIIAGMLARNRRKEGHLKSASVMEAAAIGAWTLAIAYFTEAGVGEQKAKLSAMRSQSVGAMGADELKALDDEIDDDIQSAAKRLREMAEQERADREEVREEREEADDVGALAYEGEPFYDDEDDDIF